MTAATVAGMLPSHHIVLRHPRILFGGFFGAMYRMHRLKVLVAGEVSAFHVIESAEEIGHPLGYMLDVPIGLAASPIILITSRRWIEFRTPRRAGRWCIRDAVWEARWPC
jgi:hypothetical protein